MDEKQGEQVDLQFTPELREELRKQYQLADKRGIDMFEFHGHALLTSYAKYLLEYLDTVLPATPSKPCTHAWAEVPDSEDGMVQGNGYMVCPMCGELKPPEGEDTTTFPKAHACPCCVEGNVQEQHKDDKARWYECMTCHAHFTVSGQWSPEGDTPAPVDRSRLSTGPVRRELPEGWDIVIARHPMRVIDLLQRAAGRLHDYSAEAEGDISDALATEIELFLNTKGEL